MTRLYQRLVIRLMPERLLNAMHVVYEECARTCNDRTHSPFIHPIEMFADWLNEAHEIGWTPPERIITVGDTGIVDHVDDGMHPSWRRDNECRFDELN